MGSTTFLFTTIRWRVWLRYRVVTAEKLQTNVSRKPWCDRFSRALTEGLAAGQTDAEFDAMLDGTIEGIYQASRS